MSIDLVLPLQESLRELRRGHQWVTECLEQTMTECEQRGAELAECRGQLAEVRRSLTDCELQLADKTRTEADARAQCERLRDQDETSRAELTKALEELRKAQGEVESGQLQLAAAQQREELLQAQSARLEADVEEGRTEAKELRAQFVELLESAGEAATLRGQLKAAQLELARLQQPAEPDETQPALLAHMATAETAQAELQALLTQLLADSAATQRELSQLRAQATPGDEPSELSLLRDELQLLHAEITQLQEPRLESEAEERLRDDLAASETARQDLQAQLARLLRESEGTRQELNHLREQFSPVTEGYAEMAQLRGQLHEVHAELARLAEQSTDEPLTDKLRERLTDADHQRELLESELDQVRQRGAELSEALAEQKRLAADERQRWADELRQLRGAVDRQSELLGQRPAAGPTATQTLDHVPVPEEPHDKNSNNRVLDSVLEQFEKIQRNKVRKLANT